MAKVMVVDDPYSQPKLMEGILKSAGKSAGLETVHTSGATRAVVVECDGVPVAIRVDEAGVRERLASAGNGDEVRDSDLSAGRLARGKGEVALFDVRRVLVAQVAPARRRGRSACRSDGRAASLGRSGCGRVPRDLEPGWPESCSLLSRMIEGQDSELILSIFLTEVRDTVTAVVRLRARHSEPGLPPAAPESTTEPARRAEPGSARALARRLGIAYHVTKPADESAFVRLIVSLTARGAGLEPTEAGS